VIVLGLEGALGAFSAAVIRDGKTLASQTLAGNVALEAGLAALANTLRDAHIESDALDRLAVGVGPGGFTGLRITVAYAKSLAQAWERPLVPVSSFDALELGLDLPRVLCVVTGRTGVVSARYRAPGMVARASGRIHDVLAEVLQGVEPGALPVVGAPEDVSRALAEGGFSVNPFVPLHAPPAVAVALLGASMPPAATVHEVRADYGELPAAKVPRL
jgi:tRNA threonylcarbamoyladenosine biosynthesis protein TsaB